MIIKNITDLIGKTPIIEFDDIYIKLEGFNLGGSIKDRVAYNMLREHTEIKKGDTIVTATSGNTGIGLAMVSSILKINSIIVMPENMSIERMKIMKAYGAELVLTKKNGGMNESIKKAKEIAEENKYVYIDQFTDMANPRSHKATAKEIMEEFDKIDYFVCGIGTGGTIMGVGSELKNKYPNIKIIGFEPLESPIISKGYNGVHGIQGIGAGFIPKLLDLDLINEIKTISTEDAYQEFYEIAKKGLFVGLSSAAAIRLSKKIKKENPEAIVLTISPDFGNKYLSVIDK